MKRPEYDPAVKKVGAVITETAGVDVFVPKDGGAEEGWSESNMAARLLFEERSGM